MPAVGEIRKLDEHGSSSFFFALPAATLPPVVNRPLWQKDCPLIRRRIAAFIDAGRGVFTLMKTQVHAWVHLVATVGVIACGLWFPVTASQWCMLVLAMGLVWSAEALNTAIEFVVDLVSPEHHDLAGKAKDVAAAAVLLASVAAAVVGVIVFGPHLLRLLTVES